MRAIADVDQRRDDASMSGVDGVVDEEGSGEPDRPAGSYLALRMLGHWDTHYPVWAWVGLCFLPSNVRQDLDPKAMAAVRRLRLVLLYRFTVAGELGWAEIAPAAEAVNACGEWWPIPKISARMVRDISGLDVPTVWGLDKLRRDLRHEMVDARDVLKDRDKSNNLAKTLVAAWELRDVLSAAIGGRYANEKVQASAAKIEAAWRRFDAARARGGGIIVLPLFCMRAVRGA